MNFDEPEALACGTQHGAGWRLDCLGDMRAWAPEMLDIYRYFGLLKQSETHYYADIHNRTAAFVRRTRIFRTFDARYSIVKRWWEPLHWPVICSIGNASDSSDANLGYRFVQLVGFAAVMLR
jgi:hypothetical protein